MTRAGVFLRVVLAHALFVAARAGADARILCIEPQPDVFDRLAYNVRLNPFATVKAIDCAVADKAGELTLFLEPTNSGETSMKIVGSGGASAIRVPATTLLDLVRREGFERIDAIKLDVEGAEDVILEPFLREAPEALRRMGERYSEEDWFPRPKTERDSSQSTGTLGEFHGRASVRVNERMWSGRG